MKSFLVFIAAILLISINQANSMAAVWQVWPMSHASPESWESEEYVDPWVDAGNSHEWDYPYMYDGYGSYEDVGTHHVEKRQADDSTLRNWDRVCSRIESDESGERRAPRRRLSKLSDDERQRFEQAVEQHRAAKVACCAQAGEERLSCFETMRRQKFVDICNGQETFAWHRRSDTDEIKERCCVIEGTDEIMACFVEGIHANRDAWRQDREDRRSRHEERRRDRLSRRPGVSECCDEGKEYSDGLEIVDAAACQSGAAAYQPEEEMREQQEVCQRVFERCCLSSSGLFNRREWRETHQSERRQPGHRRRHGGGRRQRERGEGTGRERRFRSRRGQDQPRF